MKTADYAYQPGRYVMIHRCGSCECYRVWQVSVVALGDTLVWRYVQQEGHLPQSKAEAKAEDVSASLGGVPIVRFRVEPGEEVETKCAAVMRALREQG